MNLATPALRDLALRLLAEESDEGNAGTSSAALRVCGKLGVLLTRLAGAAGFRSLFSRALALAQMEVPWLKAARVLPDGTLEGLKEGRTEIDGAELARGEVVLVAQLIGLLHVFIGEPLTGQLVKEAWPEVSIQHELSSKPPKP